MLELKALGNDAAHVEAKAYDSIGEAESLLSIDVATSILRPIYQMKGILARLQERQKTGTPSPEGPASAT